MRQHLCLAMMRRESNTTNSAQMLSSTEQDQELEQEALAGLTGGLVGEGVLSPPEAGLLAAPVELAEGASLRADSLYFSLR